MRVRVHLNLAAPGRAENVIKVQSPHGGWVTVAYADSLEIEEVSPVVDDVLRERVRQGEIKKVPHAFLEGNLIRFHGRWRDKAPEKLRQTLVPFSVPDPVVLSSRDAVQVGYNPRVASCFYAHKEPLESIDECFMGAPSQVAVGWAFMAHHPALRPMKLEERCAPEDRMRTSRFEHQAMSLGRERTQKLLDSPSLRRRPRPR